MDGKPGRLPGCPVRGLFRRAETIARRRRRIGRQRGRAAAKWAGGGGRFPGRRGGTSGSRSRSAAEHPQGLLDGGTAKSSLLRVADLLPDATLANLSGKTLSIRGQFGKHLTVLVFFHAGGVVGSMRSKELLQDLDRDVVAAQGKKGVAVIAVDVRDPPETVKDLVQEARVSYPVLLDSDGVYFAKVATGVFPRIYALDPEGKVLWFDLEYSTTTRYSLKQTILSVLGESPQGF